MSKIRKIRDSYEKQRRASEKILHNLEDRQRDFLSRQKELEYELEQLNSLKIKVIEREINDVKEGIRFFSVIIRIFKDLEQIL